MPRVPSVGLSPTSRPQFQAPGVVAFQGGPELQQIARGGARLERIGRIVGQIGIEVEDKVNDARAMEATNAFENSANRLLFDYRQKKGKDAVEARAELDQQMKELRDGAGGMLLNDTQRIQFNRIADRIGSRSSLAFDEHYAKAAAEDKQQQNLARQIVVSESIANNDIGPQSIVAFGQFNNLVREEGEARGLSGDALEVFALSKRDKLLQSIVTQKLDSEDPAQIMQVEGLLDSLPDGVISQTQRQNLGKLVQDKSREASSFAWASGLFADGKTYQDGVIEIQELATTDPALAQKYLSSLNTMFEAQVKAQRDRRNTMYDTFSAKVESGQPLSAAETEQAREAGILYDLQKIEREIQEGKDVTSPNGQTYFVQYDNRPSDLLDKFSSGPQVFKAARDAGCSTKDARDLAAQYNYAVERQEAAASASAAAKSKKAQFHPMSTDEAAVAETALYFLDQRTVKKLGLDASQSYRNRIDKNHRNDSNGASYAQRMLVNAFKQEVMTVANVLLSQVPEGETVDRNQIITEAARLVYDRGFMDDGKSVNRYTTEFADLPDVDEDVGQLMPQARQDLRQAESGEAIRQRLMADPRAKNLLEQAGVGVIRTEAIEDFARSMLFEPDMARALRGAKQDMPIVEATSTISEADVRARARVLNQDRVREQRIQSAEEKFDVERRIAGMLLEVGPDDLRSEENLGFFETGIFRGDTRVQNIRKWKALPIVKRARDQYISEIGNDDDWDDFVMMFYPGSDAAIKGEISDRTRRRLNDAYDTRPSVESPRPQSRFQALRLYFTDGLGSPRRVGIFQ